MWIRSQNGYSLINASNIVIEPFGNKYISTGVVNIKADNQIVAEYDTVEEALRVLDAITSTMSLHGSAVLMPQKGELK